MKRCFSAALILALLATTLLSPALADEIDVVSENAEASVAEITLLSEEDLIGESVDSEPEPADTKETDLSVDAAVQAAEADDPPVAEAAGAEASALEGDASKSATGIELSAKSLTIGVKEKYRGLGVAAVPNDSPLPKIVWRSANTKIAKVNASTGVITGVKKGSTKIYARLEGSKKEAVCKVKVLPKPKKVTLKPKSLTLGVHMDYQMKAAVPKGYASGMFTYKSNNASVATVDDTGRVVAVAPGSATITVTTYNGKKARCRLNVLDEPARVSFPDEILPLAVNQSAGLSATALTADGVATPATIAFSIDRSSPDPGCIALDEASGSLRGLRKGQAVIRATAHNGAIGRCVVDVDVAPDAVNLNMSAISIGVKELYVGLLPDLVPPAGAVTCAQSVTWSSSNPKIARVDAHTGAVTGVKSGSCSIKVTAPNGNSATCKVRVYKAPTGKTVSIKQTNAALEVGMSGQFTIQFSRGYGGSVTFESADTGIAVVDNNGIVTALRAGATTITMTTYNGIQKTAKLTVNKSSQETTGSTDDGKASISNQEKLEYMFELAQTKLGKPYVYGSFGPNSFDCSGFVYWCFKQIDIKLKDSAYKQGYDSSYQKIAYNDLKPGDVVVFNTVSDSDLSDHTGIYLGGYKFIHASSSAKKVIVSTLKSGYYKRNFSWGRRILN